MKVVILAGGLPSTLTGYNDNIPKPMLEIGERPILWHIMKHFSMYGYNEFVICGGYKVSMIKEYFNNYYVYQSDIMVDLSNNCITILKNITEDWKVTVVDTGLEARTGLRIGRIQKYINEDEFIVTYGDCLSDIAVDKMIEYHYEKKKKVTVAVTKPTGRNIALNIDKSNNYRGINDNEGEEDGSWVNTGTYILNREVFLYLQEDKHLEEDMLQRMADENMVAAYKHKGFWTPVETQRDKQALEEMWCRNEAPWKTE